QAINEVNKPFKSTSISFRLIPAMRDGACPINTIVCDKPDTLSGNRRRAALKSLCKEYCTKIGEIPSASNIGFYQTVRCERGKNCATALRKRLPHKFKVAIVIQASQNLVIGQELIRDATLPHIRLQLPPKCPKPFRMV